MAEAGKGDLNPTAKGNAEGVLERESEGNLLSLSSQVVQDVERSIKIAERDGSLPRTPEEVKKIKILYARLKESLEKIKTDELEGVGTLTVYAPKPEDPSQESKIGIKIRHYENNEDALRTTIALGSKGSVAFYEREHTPKSKKKMITKGISEDEEAPLPDIEKVVAIIESAASKSK